jgi:quercetin dioxygenase-like cupin family protein
MLKCIAVTGLAALGMVGQMSDRPSPKVVPITEEQHHHLVLENEYVRVFHVEVPPHSETLYHQHDMDYVFVTLGDSKVASERADGKSVTLELKDGDTRFTKGGFAHKAVNLSDKPFVNVTVELKKKIGTDFTAGGKPLGGEGVADCDVNAKGCKNAYWGSLAVIDSAHWKVAERHIQHASYTFTHPGLLIFVDACQVELNKGEKQNRKVSERTWFAAGTKIFSEDTCRFVTMEYSPVPLPRDQELSAPKEN